MIAIAAIDNDWGIGKDGELLFHIKEDMRFFKRMTIGKVVVMGRKTFETLPNGKPLEDRLNLVITSNPKESYDNVIFGTKEEIMEESVDAVRRGLPNLNVHIENMLKFNSNLIA